MPEAKANAALPFSIAAMLASSAALRRVLRARVLVTLVATEAVLHVCGRLVDRRDDGAGRRVGLLARVNADRAEPGVFAKLHGSRSVLQTGDAGYLRVAGHLEVAPYIGQRGPEDGRLLPGGNGTVAQLAFSLEPVVEIASVRGTAGEIQLVSAVRNVGVGQR